MINIFYIIFNKLYFYEYIYKDINRKVLFKFIGLNCMVKLGFFGYVYLKLILFFKFFKVVFVLFGNR